MNKVSRLNRKGAFLPKISLAGQGLKTCLKRLAASPCIFHASLLGDKARRLMRSELEFPVNALFGYSNVPFKF